VLVDIMSAMPVVQGQVCKSRISRVRSNDCNGLLQHYSDAVIIGGQCLPVPCYGLHARPSGRRA